MSGERISFEGWTEQIRMTGEGSYTLRALDRLAAVEAERDALADALRRIAECLVGWCGEPRR